MFGNRTQAFALDFLTVANEQLLANLKSSDPATALSAARRLRGLVDSAEQVAVRRARDAGCSWQWIAEQLGRARSAVWERYHEGLDSD
jgi:hypothetical protein